MSINPEYYMPVAKPFEEEGYKFEAWQPANSKAKRVMIIHASKDGKLVKEVEVPMHHPNIFGIDIEDMKDLEMATEHLLQELAAR